MKPSSDQALDRKENFLYLRSSYISELRVWKMSENNNSTIIKQKEDNLEGKLLTPRNRSSQSHSNLCFPRLTSTSVYDYLFNYSFSYQTVSSMGIGLMSSFDYLLFQRPLVQCLAHSRCSVNMLNECYKTKNESKI